MPTQNFHLHLVSDATGETVQSVARACLVQFEEIPHEDATEARFMELDTDQDGLLSPAEFLPFLRQMLGAPSDAGSLKSAPNLATFP